MTCVGAVRGHCRLAFRGSFYADRPQTGSGKGAVIHPHGVLFRGGAEAAIRKRLVRQGYIRGIIGLPANLFYGTGDAALLRLATIGALKILSPRQFREVPRAGEV